MDLPIYAITPDMQRTRGADAFDEGRSVDDHHMNRGSLAIKDWQFGWHQRRVERDIERRRIAQRHLVQTAQQEAACPP